MSRPVAILGGTFDPIHYGHLVTAETVREEMHMEKVLLIPSGQPPHKTDHSIASAEDRYRMVALAAASNPHFVPSRIEIERNGYSYSADTIHALRQMHPDVEWYFIVGFDAFQDILTWHTPQVLLDACHLVVATRPGYTLREDPALREFMKRNDSHLHFLHVPALDISSSELRTRVREGRSLRYLVPESVEAYIKEHRLYQ